MTILHGRFVFTTTAGHRRESLECFVRGDYLYNMNRIRSAALLVSIAIVMCVCIAIGISCEQPVSAGSPSNTPDTTDNVEIQGVYYGILTTDYYDPPIGRTTSRVHVNVSHASEERNGCTCAYNIQVYDSVATIAYLCVVGKSSRLTSDCTDDKYHDIFLGTGNGSSLTGYIERYKVQPVGPETHYSTLSFDVEKR